MTDLKLILSNLKPCPAALEWVAAQGSRAPEVIWRACPRGDWLFWLVARLGLERGLIVEAACDCAETGLIYVPTGEDRPRRAIEVARRWACGEATLEEVRAAADAADAAAEAAEAYISRATARAAARAAEAAEAAVAAEAAAVAEAAAAAAASRAAEAAYVAVAAASRAAEAAYVAVAVAAYAAADGDADAAYAVAVVASDSAEADAYATSLARSADLVRARIPWAVVEARIAALEGVSRD